MRISLTALRAFEATARLGSMSQAAAELRVGLASVSRHISALQARLRVELLAREGRGVVLTPAGRAYFADITVAFSSIVEATEGVSRQSAPRGPRLTIAAEPCFAHRGLMPRLMRFQDTEPGLTLQLMPTNGESDAQHEGAAVPDVTLGWRRVLDDLEDGAQLLAEPRVVALAAAMTPEPASVTALVRGSPLIHQRSPEQWARWLNLAGHTGEPPRLGMVVPDKAWALTGAGSGLGFALVCETLAQAEIETGRCRQVLGAGFHMGGYVASRAARPTGDVAVAGRFIEWVGAQLRQPA